MPTPLNGFIQLLGAEGVALHQGSDLYDLANNVDVSETYVVTVPMIAPAEPGTYTELWSISGGVDTYLFQFYVTIEVQ